MKLPASLKKKSYLRKNGNKGFTLIELTIYVGLISLVLVLFSSLAINLSRLRDQAYAMLEVDYNARNIISVISENIRKAGSLAYPEAGSATSTLVFAVDESQQPSKISLMNNEVYLVDPAGNSQKVSGDAVNVLSLAFTNSSPPGSQANILISLELEGSGSGTSNRYNQKYESSVTLRR